MSSSHFSIILIFVPHLHIRGRHLRTIIPILNSSPITFDELFEKLVV